MLAGFAKMMLGNKVHDMGHRRGPAAKVDVRAARAVFIDIHADDALAKVYTLAKTIVLRSRALV